ncbi:MAG TPA: hypothetical protein VN604_08740 [Nitrospirota bacterium]|nr:hypothetical protein [Nitrospirota bacterium]
MPNTRKNGGDTAERLRILEKAVASLADSQRKRETDVDDEIRDILVELKALKVFLSRSLPDFKKQFPEIQRKVK